MEIIKILLCMFLMGMGKRDANRMENKEKEISRIVDANNEFALKLYQQLKDKEENVFFSPFSIQSAFLILYEGAKGTTKKEIESVFGFLPDSKIRRENFRKIFNEINKKDKKYNLYTANAIWVQKDFKVLKQYLNVVKEWYLSEINNLDFVKEPEKSVEIINSWVFEKTKGKIKDLISRDAIDALTRLIITNAIYFKGMWLKKFDKENTKEGDFWISKNKKVKVPMMHMKKERFNYFEDENIQVIEIPYDGNEVSMIVFLPKSFEVNSINKYLNTEKLKEIIRNFNKEKVNVYLPKFKIETKYFLKEILNSMGVKDVFTTGANLSGITGEKNIFVSKVIHKAFVEVNEEGTEAAAATGIVVELTMVKPVKIFKANHPFIFLIYDKKFGNILFFGRVVNPT